MTRIRVRHETSFVYEDAVMASYNEVRMRPLMSDRQFVLTEQVLSTPMSASHTFVDYWGTRVTSLEILQPHDRLDIVAESLVEIFPQAGGHHPLSWEELHHAPEASMPLTELLQTTALTAPPEEVAQFARDTAAHSESPDDAARKICSWVYESMTYEFGVTAWHSSAADAWREKKGVCQDISHLVLGALRSIRIPARYVSGYLHPQEDAELGESVRGESHAWVEWFSGGFVAHDPTNDKVVADRHVVVGRGRDYLDVLPLRGVYDGPKTSGHRVDVHLTLER